jgi:hypothetical protein
MDFITTVCDTPLAKYVRSGQDNRSRPLGIRRSSGCYRQSKKRAVFLGCPLIDLREHLRQSAVPHARKDLDQA